MLHGELLLPNLCVFALLCHHQPPHNSGWATPGRRATNPPGSSLQAYNIQTIYQKGWSAGHASSWHQPKK
jgi:hypothetical protein